MRNYYDKHYYEKVAKETLAAFVDKNFDLLLNLDRPDLQSVSKEIGIEVTRAITTYEGRAISFCNQYFNKNNSTEFLENKMKQMDITHGKILTAKGTNIRAFTPYSGLEDMTRKKIQVANNIKVKIDLFQTYDINFKRKEIYIFCEWVYELFDIDDIINYINDYSCINTIYFDCMDRIYIYNIKNDSVEVCFFKKEKYKDILREAINWRKSFYNN